MAEWRIIPPEQPDHWEKLYQLRYDVLRKPWDQPIGSERAEDDIIALHAIVLNASNEVIATCRAHKSGESQAQIRYMAVRPDMQKMGLGKAILTYIEKRASSSYAPLHQLILHARDHAVPFYVSHGYEVIGPSYTLFGNIQHIQMIKSLV